MKTKKSNLELFNPVLPDIMHLNKTQLEVLAIDLKSNIAPIDEYVSLYKLNFLIQERMKNIKKKAKENYLESFKGVTDNTYLNFKISYRINREFQYSDAITKIEDEIKQMKKILTAEKNLEKQNGKAKLINEEGNLYLQLL